MAWSLPIRLARQALQDVVPVGQALLDLTDRRQVLFQPLLVDPAVPAPAQRRGRAQSGHLRAPGGAADCAGIAERRRRGPGATPPGRAANRCGAIRRLAFLARDMTSRTPKRLLTAAARGLIVNQ